MKILRSKIIFLLIFINYFGFSQELEIRSATDLKGIPFVTITYTINDSIVGGTYTNERGIASLNLKKNVDKIKISHLGFHSKTIEVVKLNDVPIVYLEEKTQELSEVIIYKGGVGSNWIGNVLNKKNAFISARRGFEISTLIKENSYSSGDKLKNIKFNIKRRKEVYSAIVKLNFYECVNDFPKNLINNQDITVIIDSKSKGEIIVDLDGYNIYLPKGGVFIGVEWLGLVDVNGTLLQNDSYNDCSIGFNLTEIKNSTFIRNKFSDLNWNNFNLKDEKKDLFYLPAFALEIN